MGHLANRHDFHPSNAFLVTGSVISDHPGATASVEALRAAHHQLTF
jgi:hypothetical protein